VITVFVLMVYIGLGDNEKLHSDKMIFRSLMPREIQEGTNERLY
jgi:hypothetical protein